MFEKEVNPEKIEKTDLVVCIPSYNESDAISYPTTQASKGLIKYFHDINSVIINCDNNSPDNTKQAFLDTPTEIPKIYLSTPSGVKGKGNNFKTFVLICIIKILQLNKLGSIAAFRSCIHYKKHLSFEFFKFTISNTHSINSTYIFRTHPQ